MAQSGDAKHMHNRAPEDCATPQPLHAHVECSYEQLLEGVILAVRERLHGASLQKAKRVRVVMWLQSSC